MWCYFSAVSVPSACAIFSTLFSSTETAYSSSYEMYPESLCKENEYSYNKYSDEEILFTAEALAHIIERHLLIIKLFPQKSKFTISSVEIVAAIKQSAAIPKSSIVGSPNFQRVLLFHKKVGFDRSTSQETNFITIITNPEGYLYTAFPGLLK